MNKQVKKIIKLIETITHKRVELMQEFSAEAGIIGYALRPEFRKEAEKFLGHKIENNKEQYGKQYAVSINSIEYDYLLEIGTLRKWFEPIYK